MDDLLPMLMIETTAGTFLHFFRNFYPQHIEDSNMMLSAEVLAALVPNDPQDPGFAGKTTYWEYDRCFGQLGVMFQENTFGGKVEDFVQPFQILRAKWT